MKENRTSEFIIEALTGFATGQLVFWLTLFPVALIISLIFDI